MRIAISILFFALLYGCSPSTVNTDVLLHGRIVLDYSRDFQKYSQEGFFFSYDSYHGAHYLMRDINLKVHPEVLKYTSGDIDTVKYDVIHNTGSKGGVYYDNTYLEEKISSDTLIYLAYQEAKKVNADAIVKFNITTNSMENGTIRNFYYVITGEAIKRTDK